MTIPALALVLAFSILLTAILRPPARAAAWIYVYLLSYANIVLAGLVANSFLRLNDPAWWLALHLTLLAGAWLAWRRAGKPSLIAPWLDTEGRFVPAGWRRSLKQWPDVWILGLGICLLFLFTAVLIWVMPPNNNDSLATHMSRVGFWMQRGSFFPWPTSRVWQITYPVNMQLQMFWTVLFLGTDRIVEVVQWLGALTAMAAVYGLARLLGALRPQAFFAALIWATFPEIILESTTTQNDLVAGTLFAAMLYLFFLGLSKGQPGVLVLSGLALGLGLGTKQTLLFLLPGLGIVTLLALIYCGRGTLKRLVTWGIGGLVAFLLLGAYMYLVNQVTFGHPMGPKTAVEAQTGGQTAQSLRDNLVFSTVRLAYQAIDPTGLPDPLTGYGFKAKALVAGALFDWVGFPIEEPIAVAPSHRFNLRERYVLQEDAAWYGPLFSFLVLPAIVFHLVQGLRRKDLLRVSIFILSLTFLLVNAALRPGWDPFQGRYFIPVVTIAAPLLAFYARPGWPGALGRWVIVILALIIAVTTVRWNSGKPVNHQQNIFSMSRLERQTLQSFYMQEPMSLVEEQVPADATLGLLVYGAYLEYPFFREDFSRRLVHIYPPERIGDANWLRAQGIEFLLVQHPDGALPVKPASELVTYANLEGWMLLTWKSP